MQTMTATGAEREERAGGRLDDLYRRHAPDAVRLAYLLTGDRALAEDLTQEAFVRMFGRFRDLRNPDAFGAYLRKTVVNLTRSHFRRVKVERAYVARERTMSTTTSSQPDVAARDEMWQALLRLPERQRTAVVLRYYEDLSEAQTADAMRCPQGTVKSLVSRGLDRLRQEMKRDA
jgi:RNA polymerase sigma-70 factor (sigma-E family)